jgi:hypothetical protein
MVSHRLMRNSGVGIIHHTVKGAGAAQGRGDAAMQAEMCGGWRGKGLHGSDG